MMHAKSADSSYPGLDIDLAAEVAKISAWMRKTLSAELSRRGFVVAISGGIDSSVCAALSVAAVGAKRVFGLLLPEQDSSSNSTLRGKAVAQALGIEYELVDIAPTLEALGCYRWRDEAIRNVVPAYGPGWKNKIVLSGGLEGRLNHFLLVTQDPNGVQSSLRLPLKEYLQIVAATNHKQRIRKTIEYFHADRLNYAVVGTPNRLEYDQGFFVKNGDGSADLKPIAHLYKTQVYRLARHLNLPEDVCAAVPTTDTYSLPQGQDEFYFALPYQKMDVALFAHENDLPASELAQALDIHEDKARLIYKDIERKRQFARYLHAKAFTMLAPNVSGL
jgi:NAD+ synthase